MTREDAGFEGPSPGVGALAVERQDEIFRDTFPGMLGVRILEARGGYARGTLEVGPSVVHPGGFAHGGALAGFGDTVAAWATFPALERGQDFTTIEFKSNFLRGVREGRLVGEATEVHHGSRTMVLQVSIRTDDDDAKLVAMMLVTQAIIPAR